MKSSRPGDTCATLKNTQATPLLAPACCQFSFNLTPQPTSPPQQPKAPDSLSLHKHSKKVLKFYDDLLLPHCSMYCKPGQERISLYKCSISHSTILSEIFFQTSLSRQMDWMNIGFTTTCMWLHLCFKEPQTLHVGNNSHKDKPISKTWSEKASHSLMATMSNYEAKVIM